MIPTNNNDNDEKMSGFVILPHNFVYLVNPSYLSYSHSVLK